MLNSLTCLFSSQMGCHSAVSVDKVNTSFWRPQILKSTKGSAGQTSAVETRELLPHTPGKASIVDCHDTEAISYLEVPGPSFWQ